ncbi:hypothetical protein SDC9_195081 [bioreactor metagenome]|uniref:Uncharacterized protein n=1 Tax=bioreactor metagenome TaxID=1076179 RepID=A0A645IAK5_9ZZZZ
MADPGGQPKQYRHPETFRKLERLEQQIIGLLRIRRLQHRHAGRRRVTAVVLFVLTRSHPGIVGGDHHQPARRAGIGHGKKRVGRDIESDMLHRHQRTHLTERSADGGFNGGFFVGRPLGAPSEFGEFLQNFRGRRPRIPGAERDPGIESAQRDRLIAAQQLFLTHSDSPDWLPLRQSTFPDVRPQAAESTD